MIPLLVSLLLAAVACGLWGVHLLGEVRPEPADLDFLEAKDSYALHVLRIVASADYRHYASRSPRYRRYLFRSYARNLKQDVAELSALPTDLAGVCYRWVFEILYRALLAKSKLAVGTSDLHVLLGAELKFIRRLRP